ncbi:MAG: polysaccharide biosynthesis/export family protein [Pirellulales bacterium]|nr:polysaccharide biosynthesis/export family protein [Pirellulales bacterium]
MLQRFSPRVRFSLVNLLFLVFGIAIGFAANVRTWELLVGLAANEAYRTSLPDYTIRPPDVIRVAITSSASHATVSGEYLVTPDGSVNLGFLGSVPVAGKTISEAQAAIQSAAKARLTEPQVNVDVYGYNSSVYYIVEQEPGRGDFVTRLPITGNETVLDAVAQIGGIQTPERTRVWISRPSANGVGAAQVLPLDWKQVSQGTTTTTNYQILPGDRVFIARADVP